MAGTIYANEADGSVLYLATQEITLDDGTRLEGTGVRPDIEVPFSIPFAQGQDPQKDRAVSEAARLVPKHGARPSTEPTTAKCAGLDEDAPGAISDTSVVPEEVPSVFHSGSTWRSLPTVSVSIIKTA